MTQIQTFRVAELIENPESTSIHADFDPAGADAWLVDDIRANNVVVPIIVRPDKVISDGHRRRRACLHLGITDIPGFQSSDVFRSAQLARHMGTYARCMLYRAEIEQLVSEGKAAKLANLPNVGADGPRRDIEQEWIKLEKILGVERATLTKGVKLLADLDTMRNDPDLTHQAAKIAHIFRNRGLWPALRMLGEETASVADEVDCRRWETDEKPRQKKPPKKFVKCAKKPAPKKEHWQTKLLSHIRDIRAAFDKRGLLDDDTNGAIVTLERAIDTPALKVAA
jgi:hypothetical protein